MRRERDTIKQSLADALGVLKECETALFCNCKFGNSCHICNTKKQVEIILNGLTTPYALLSLETLRTWQQLLCNNEVVKLSAGLLEQIKRLEQLQSARKGGDK